MAYYTALTCVMPDCTADLNLHITTVVGLYEDDLDEHAGAPTPADAISASWTVECVEGHVVLLPGPAGCPCDDQGGDDCPHGDGDGYDASDDTRTFQRHDAARLKQLVAQLRSATQHVVEFRADGWTIQHPLSCRPALFDCPINRVAEVDLAEPPPVLGRFEVTINDLGDRLQIGDHIETPRSTRTEAIDRRTLRDCTHGAGCPLHPSADQLHNFDPQYPQDGAVTR